MDTEIIETIRVNHSRVTRQIHDAATSVGRESSTIRLVVVTKGHAAERIRHAIQAGLNLFAENYVEEAIEKMDILAGYSGLEWHMIGHVQSRKARAVCEHFNYLHSLDSVKLANRLDRFAEEKGIVLPVLLECNVSGEESKFGFPAWDDNRWQDLIVEIKGMSRLRNLKISGLMTMAPYFEEPEMARPYFRRLRNLRDFFSTKLPEIEWKDLSMGMSGDFSVAVQEGATILRIGTAIMGIRT